MYGRWHSIITEGVGKEIEQRRRTLDSLPMTQAYEDYWKYHWGLGSVIGAPRIG